MRTRLSYLLGLFALCLASVLPVQAQDAFYIYRNDGHFNAFFNDRVDSIVYSRLDVDSMLHADYVVQEIYTPDSIYRIPLETIDSVSFVAPEVVFNADVTRAETLLANYLQGADGLRLILSNAMPDNQKPQVGQILFSLDFTNPALEEGFAGRVARTYVQGANLVVECDSVDLTEIFDQFVGVEEVSSDASAPVRSSLRRLEGYDEGRLFGYDLNLNHEFLKTDKITATVRGHFGGGSTLKAVWKFTRRERFLEMTLTDSKELNFGFELEGELIDKTWKEKVGPAATVRFPATMPILKCQLQPAIFLKVDAKAALNFSAECAKETSYTVTYSDGDFSFHTSRSLPGSNWHWDFGSKFSLEGSVHAGALLDFYFGTVNMLGLGFAGARADFYIGPKMTATVDVDLTAIPSLNGYEMLKDSKVELSGLTIDVEAKGEAKFPFQTTKEHTFFEGSADFFTAPLYLFPEFSELELETYPDSRTANVLTHPTRNLIKPLTLGIGLYDEDDNLVQKAYDSETYWMLFGARRDLNATFTDLGYNEYTARPIIRFLGTDWPATPTASFKLGQAAPRINAVRVTSATFSPNGYTSPYLDGSHKIRYKLAIDLSINDLGGVEMWGYIYVTPSGQSMLIPAGAAPGALSFTDTRDYGLFMFDEPRRDIELIGFVKYYGDDEVYEGEPQRFTIEYPATASLQLTGCSLQSTKTNQTYRGATYKYCSSFKFNFNMTGAYWLLVGQQEFGSGWAGWTLPDYTAKGADGANALVINYYYDDKSFSGDYNVRLLGADETHGMTYYTPEYATYTYGSAYFTGATYNAGAGSRGTRPLVLDFDDTENVIEYNIVIDKPVN